MVDKYVEIKRLLLYFLENDDFLKNIEKKYIKFYDILGEEEFKYNYSKILMILLEFDNKNINLLGDKLEKISTKIMNNNYFIDKKYLKENILKLFNFIFLEIQRISYMKTIDSKTEINKKELLDRLKVKDVELDNIRQNLNIKMEEVDKKAMEKMSMYLSIFTLIAGNIAVLFKGIDVSPLELAALVFIINSVLVLSIGLLFYFVNKNINKKVYIISFIGTLLGILLLILSTTSLNNSFKRNIEKNIDIKYNQKFNDFQQELMKYKEENIKLKLEIDKLKDKK